MAGTLRFTRVQCDELDPGSLPVPFQDSTMGPFTHWKQEWLRLTTDDGIIGQAPGSVTPALAAVLIESGPLMLDEWWHKIFWLQRNSGHRNPATAGMLFAVDMAMRDILAQRAGLPLHRHIGSTRNAVPVYGSGGATSYSIEQLTTEMTDMAACGFKTVKMKVGKNFGTCMDEDVERVRAVRQALGNGMGLAVDANQIWSASEALTFARRIAGFNIAWFEEPVHSADRAALRELCKQCPIPVAMGESENHWLGFRDLLECGVQHLQPPPHGLPGFARWRDAVGYAETQGGLWSSGGYSHLTAMYVATRPAGLVEYLRSIIGHLATIYSTKPTIADGMITLPSTPGLPVTVDWERLENQKAIRSLVDRRA